MMKYLIFIIVFIMPLELLAQKVYPESVIQVLEKSGKNRQELETALKFFYKKGDSLQVKAIEFLIANMDIHSSANYYWKDKDNKRIYYNEMDYKDMSSAIKSFEELKRKYPGLTPHSVTYLDIDSVKADLLIENVELAFIAWNNQKTNKAPFNDFCEYILPYRTSIEPLQNWRKYYNDKFASLVNVSDPIDTQLLRVGENIKHWFANTYNTEKRREPLPRLGALQLLSRAKGPCEDISGLAAFMLRSQGLVGTCDIVTYWATSSGMHFCNGTYNDNKEPIRFDASTGTVRFGKFEREPAKVIRTTYSNRKEALANQISSEKIPNGFMRMKNYIDVTNLYWPVDSFRIKSFSESKNDKVIYACVFNFGNWHPAWWSKSKNGAANFTNMSKGVVYLPVTYSDNKIKPASWPIALGYNNKAILKIDTVHKISVTIPSKEGYLLYRSQKKYSLYYWNNKWVKHSTRTAEDDTKEMVFEKVPSNCLYILLPEYTQHKDRPFIQDEKGGLHYF